MRLALATFLIVHSTVIAFGSADTTLPTGRLVDPAPLALLTHNTILVSAEAQDRGSGIKEVRFFVSYYPFIDSLEIPTWPPGRARPVHLIGKAKSPPYKLFWDVSGIPDQDNWRMQFYCDIEDSASNVLQKAGGMHRWMVLDRNPHLSTKRFVSKFHKSEIIMDGSLDEWPQGDTLYFKNGNNEIRARSLWDRHKLYFGIQVRDQQLQKQPHDTIPYWAYDCIEIYMDMNKDRIPFRMLDDRQLDIGVADTFNGNIVEFKQNINRRWRDGVQCKVVHRGTLNRNQDRDSGYTIEVSYLWEQLGIKPVTGTEIGFDIFNDDNDFGEKVLISRGWSGTERYNNNNPSEWGTLILQKQQKDKTWIMTVLIILAGSGMFLSTILRQRHRRRRGRIPSRPEQIVRLARQYLTENFHRGDLTLTKTADDLGMSAGHLRQMIRKVTGKPYSDYLRDLRMDRARHLLKSSGTVNISQIARDCGFNSLEYFTSTFKKCNQGQTPSQFRAENLNSA